MLSYSRFSLTQVKSAGYVFNSPIIRGVFLLYIMDLTMLKPLVVILCDLSSNYVDFILALETLKNETR